MLRQLKNCFGFYDNERIDFKSERATEVLKIRLLVSPYCAMKKKNNPKFEGLRKKKEISFFFIL